MFTGGFDSVHIGDDLLSLDNQYYPPRQPKLSYQFKTEIKARGFGADRVKGFIKVSRRRFPVIGYRYGWGNWCFDLVIMTAETAVTFMNYLKELDLFQVDSGETEFFETFNEPGLMFGDEHLPALRERGYQAP